MNSERILVVDDEPAFRELMRSHLQRHGYVVQAAGDGREALQVLQADKNLAILVTDLAMPHMGGLELLREAKRLDPQLEVIVISANDTIDSAIAAMRENGAYDYLCKPLNPTSQLSAAVGRAAEYRRLRLEREALQAQVAAEAERLQTVIANAEDAILSADAQGILRVANPAAERLLGQGQLIGTRVLESLPPRLARLVLNWDAVGNHQPITAELPWSESTTHTVSLTPLPGRGGQPDGWVMVVHDITHLKQLEALQMRVLTETANKIQIPLMQAISTLAEINQTAEVRGGQSLDVVFRLSRLLNRIREWMDELLIVARIEAGIGIQPTMVNVPELIQEWARGFNDKAVQEKTTRVNVALGKELPPVYADRDLMRRMLEQAIGQAVDKSKARPDEAVRLTVDCHQGQVWLGIVDAASSVAASAAPRRLATGTLDARLKSERAGQDLIMVRAIVNRMGGQVWARGQDTLAICLPAARSNGK